MPFVKTDFPGLVVFEPAVFEDSRGYFFESYNQRTFSAAGIELLFVQDNQAASGFGVIRGLHYQVNPHAQSKLIRVLSGSIVDVAVDIRYGSPTYGKGFAIKLSAENKRQLFVPRGFAHGYSVTSDRAEVLYKCDEFYHKESERGISYRDTSFALNWEIPDSRAIISEKDATHPPFNRDKPDFIFEV